MRCDSHPFQRPRAEDTAGGGGRRPETRDQRPETRAVVVAAWRAVILTVGVGETASSVRRAVGSGQWEVGSGQAIAMAGRRITDKH